MDGLSGWPRLQLRPWQLPLRLSLLLLLPAHLLLWLLWLSLLLLLLLLAAVVECEVCQLLQQPKAVECCQVPEHPQACVC
jgi:hypothetical protein